MQIIRDLPYQDYAGRPGINASLLKTVDRYSLAHARAYLDGKDERGSDALDFGTAFHSLLLEGRTDFAIQPETYAAPASHDKVKKFEIAVGSPLPWSGNASICKKWLAEQGGKTILTAGEAAELMGMVAAIQANETLAPLLNGDRELSIFGERDGLPTKARLDLLPRDSEIVIDFKKTRSAEPKKFLRQAIELGYHLQCAWIIDVLRSIGIERKEVWMVGIEQTFPHAICILRFADVFASFLRVGRVHCRSAFHRLKIAQETGHWPDYGSHEAEEHAMPWMLKELEQTA